MTWMNASLAAILLVLPGFIDNDLEDGKTPGTTKQANAPEFEYQPFTVSGEAVDNNGKIVVGATIYLVSTNNSPHKVLAQTVTDKSGRYEFREQKLPYYAPRKKDDSRQGTFQIFGKAPGYGFAWSGMRFLFVDPNIRVTPSSYGFFPDDKIAIDLEFAPPKSLAGSVVDGDGRPIPGVKTSVTDCDYVDTTDRETKQAFRMFRDAVRLARQVMPDQVQTVSDSNGRFDLKSVPKGILCGLSLEHPDYGRWTVATATSEANLPDEYDGEPLVRTPFHWVRHKVRTVTVQVRHADTKKPLTGALVGAYQRLGNNNDWGTSDKEGKVVLKLVPEQNDYTIWSHPPKGADYLVTQTKFGVKPIEAPQSVELVHEQACVLVLKAMDVATGKGVEGVSFWYQKDANSGQKPSVQSSDQTNDYPVTNADGELRIIVAPGTRRYGIGFNPLPGNYKAGDDDKNFGRELKLVPGKEITAEFLVRQ